jgi:hypothetical protein
MVPEEYSFKIVPSVTFNASHFRAQPEEARELGCTPDYNAYTMEENEKPNSNTCMRTASGHIHIGFIDVDDPMDPVHMTRCAVLAKQLDFYLGLPSVLWDRDIKRRLLYGKAGCYRPKSYGMEYRVLSNAWLLTPERMRFVFNATQFAIQQLKKGNRPFVDIREGPLTEVINSSLRMDAQYYLDKYSPEISSIIPK